MHCKVFKHSYFHFQSASNLFSTRSFSIVESLFTSIETSTHLTFAVVMIFSGVVMLDREESSLSSIAEKMVDALVSKKEIRSGDRDGVLRALLQNRRSNMIIQV